MSKYSHIMAAVDLTEESAAVADKAVALARQNEAQLSIIHVIEPINFAYGGDIPLDLSAVQHQLDEHARGRLEEFARRYQIPAQDQHLIAGLPQHEIHRVAQEQAVDLVVLGSHGRHGLALLFGSTANGVLHGAKCDVLAVRVGK